MAEGLSMGELYIFEPDIQAVPHQDDRIAHMLRGEVEQLEERLRKWLAVEHCIAVSGVVQGLKFALMVCGIGQGDHVLCSGFAGETAIAAILAVGGIPMLVDINPNTYNMDPFCLEYVLGKCQRTNKPVPKALIAANAFGLPCNYTALSKICDDHGISLIEDMSQSMGGAIGESKTGTFGRFSVASLSLDSAAPQEEDGGAIFCRSMGDAQHVRDLMEQEADTGTAMGLSRSFVQANFANEWMSQLQSHLEKRQKIARIYRSRLEGVCRLQHVDEPYSSAYTRFVLALPQPERREEILVTLRAQDVDCTSFQNIWEAKAPQNDWDRVMLLNSRNAAEKLIEIPIFPYLTAHLAQRICDLVVDAVLGKKEPSKTTPIQE